MRRPAVSDEIFYATIRELGARYRKREVSPVEVTRALLARIEKLDPLLHAFVTLTADRALDDARAAEEALRRGDGRPLLGIPVAHKDIYLTRGIRTTGGSALFGAAALPNVAAAKKYGFADRRRRAAA
jgi:Asp-tRNA(Asn)/Glu-tRNA(Gln) amidotransferase A subunit family amidase